MHHALGCASQAVKGKYQWDGICIVRHATGVLVRAAVTCTAERRWNVDMIRPFPDARHLNGSSNRCAAAVDALMISATCRSQKGG